MIGFFKELNGIKEEITFSLFNEDEPKLELANRDKTIYQMGFQPTQEYIEKTYNIKTTALIKEQELSAENYSTTKKGGKDFKPFKNALNTPLIPFKLPLNKNIAFDEIDNWIENLKLKDLDLQSLLENAKSFEEVLSAIEKSLQGEDLEIAEALLAKAIMNAQIYGAING